MKNYNTKNNNTKDNYMKDTDVMKIDMDKKMGQTVERIVTLWQNKIAHRVEDICMRWVTGMPDRKDIDNAIKVLDICGDFDLVEVKEFLKVETTGGRHITVRRSRKRDRDTGEIEFKIECLGETDSVSIGIHYPQCGNRPSYTMDFFMRNFMGLFLTEQVKSERNCTSRFVEDEIVQDHANLGRGIEMIKSKFSKNLLSVLDICVNEFMNEVSNIVNSYRGCLKYRLDILDFKLNSCHSWNDIEKEGKDKNNE